MTTCPKCGHQNEDNTINCTKCHVNLKWALENKDQLEYTENWEGKNEIESKLKPTWETSLKIGLWLISPVAVLIIVTQFTWRTSGPCPRGPSFIALSRSDYDKTTKAIHDSIAGNNPEFLDLESFFYHESISPYERNPSYCRGCMITIRSLLLNAYESVLNNDNIVAQEYLKQAETYVKKHPGCLDDV